MGVATGAAAEADKCVVKAAGKAEVIGSGAQRDHDRVAAVGRGVGSAVHIDHRRRIGCRSDKERSAQGRQANR